MNGEQVLALIRVRAQNEPGTAARALLYLIDETLPGIRTHLRMRIAAPGDSRHIGYMEGEANAVSQVEEALFEVFQMWPVTDLPRWLPAADAVTDLPRQVWAELLAALADDATGRQRAVARGRLLALARESWMQAPPDPR